MIKFGTDGWRGLIARDFTFDNIQLVALATARYMKKKINENPSVVIGYDTRFLSKEFAHEAAQVMAWEGVTVNLTDNIATTPEVSYQTKQKSADLGIVITASHNPPRYNGYKVKASFGGPATPEMIADLEAELKRITTRPPQFKFNDIDFYVKNKKIRFFDAKESYIRYLRKKIDLKAIQEAGFKILYDPMHGAGINHIHDLLPDAEEIHGDYNPSFGNIDHPEPIGECLPEMMQMMRSGKYDFGVATDGDADRLGCFDHEGNFVDSHKIFVILMKYLYEVKKKRGAVAKTVSLTSMVDKYCEKKKITLHETAVGFKHIAKLMNEEKILIGGEESGGLSTILHIPERDGFFNALLLLEVMATEKKSLKQLCDDLDEEFGIHRFMRRDVAVTQQKKDQILSAAAKMPKNIGRYEVKSILTKDGYKFFVDNGWLLIRPSGTEPLIRFYAEADSMNKVDELIEEGLKLR
jgi:phosphomannomutase